MEPKAIDLRRHVLKYFYVSRKASKVIIYTQPLKQLFLRAKGPQSITLTVRPFQQ